MAHEFKDKLEHKTTLGQGNVPKAQEVKDYKQIALKAASEKHLRQAFNDAMTHLLADMTPEEIAAELDKRGITNYIAE